FLGVVAALLVAVVAVVADDSCPSDWTQDKLLAHDDCNKFYMCRFGDPVEMTCWGDLFFNIHTWKCDSLSEVDCGERNIPGQEPTTTAEPETEPTTAEPTTTEPTTEEPVTPAPGFLENGCPVDPYIHWLLPVEGDCNGFYYCVWGELVLSKCAPGLHFNRELQVCDWPENAGCTTSLNKHNIGQYLQRF
ncbi:peritrophin-1-like, partial [Cydia strobilella]|uniref:peritrophin-1-like n=1 Tax=Cydia strobilella TaxID=1100964 RepID=UPI003004478C